MVQRITNYEGLIAIDKTISIPLKLMLLFVENSENDKFDYFTYLFHIVVRTFSVFT